MGFDEIYEQMVSRANSAYVIHPGKTAKPPSPFCPAWRWRPREPSPWSTAAKRLHRLVRPVVTTARREPRAARSVQWSAKASRRHRSRGFRNAALVGGGGLSFAAVGAILGGLGGLTLGPVALHPFGGSSDQSPSIAGAIDHPSGTASVANPRAAKSWLSRRSQVAWCTASSRWSG